MIVYLGPGRKQKIIAKTEIRAHNLSICQRSHVTETVTHIFAVDSEFNSVTVENADPAAEFSSLMRGMEDSVLILSVRKQRRNDRCSDLI